MFDVLLPIIVLSVHSHATNTSLIYKFVSIVHPVCLRLIQNGFRQKDILSDNFMKTAGKG